MRRWYYGQGVLDLIGENEREKREGEMRGWSEGEDLMEEKKGGEGMRWWYYGQGVMDLIGESEGEKREEEMRGWR